MRIKLIFLLAVFAASLSPVRSQNPLYTDAWLNSVNRTWVAPCGGPGATTTDQIKNIFINLKQSSGGTLDLNCYQNDQTITADIFSTVTQPIIMFLPEHAVTVNANSTIGSNFMICSGPGGSIAAGLGFTLTNNAQPCFGAAATLPGPPLNSVQINHPLGTFAGFADFTWDNANQNALWGNKSSLDATQTNQWIIGYQNSSLASDVQIFGEDNSADANSSGSQIFGTFNTLVNGAGTVALGFFNALTGNASYVFGHNNTITLGGQFIVGLSNSTTSTAGGGDVFGSNNGYRTNPTRIHIYGDANDIIGPGDDNHAYGEGNILGPSENVGFAFGGFNTLTGATTNQFGNYAFGSTITCAHDSALVYGILVTCPGSGVFMGAAPTPNIWITGTYDGTSGTLLDVQLSETESFVKGSTVTVNKIQCPSGASLTTTDCGASPGNWVGVARDALGTVAYSGMQLVVTAGDAVVGHTVCVGSDSPEGTDSGGSSPCANGTQLGIVMSITNRGAATRLPLVLLARD